MHKIRSDRGSASLTAIIVAIVVIVIVALIVGAVNLFGGWDRVDGGHVAVIRNGGSFNNANCKGVLLPGSGRQKVGITTHVHKYPSNQRFYTVAADGSGDRNGVDVIQVPSSDGIELGIEAQVYFQLNVPANKEQAKQVLCSFDNEFGTRTFTGNDKKQKHVYDGDEGWNAFLDQVVRPVINNALRIEIGNYKCSDLLSSCALLYNANLTPAQATGTGGAAQSNINLAKVEQAIGSELQSDLNTSLNGNYLTGIRFNLNGVRLPTAVQDSINQGLQKITQAQANLKAAQADAAANDARQKGYNACPSCAIIDELKALPPGITTYAPGGSAVVGLVPSTKSK